MLEAGKRNATDTQNLSSGVKDMRNSLNKSAFRLISASYIDGFMVHLEFQDGKEFDLDLGKTFIPSSRFTHSVIINNTIYIRFTLLSHLRTLSNI